MSEVKVSVIIPTCHRNDLLAKCLDCLAPSSQTLPAEQYEVIVTDDGTKSTAEQMIQENYSWARWVAGPHKGPAANRNNGAKFAKGTWLAFTDDDCLPKPQWLDAYIQAIKSNVYVYEGKTTCEAGISSPLEHAPINLDGGWLWSCNLLIERESFQQLNGFDENFPSPYLEDVDFRERLKAKQLFFPFIEAAVVDHPPRPALWGARMGATHASDVYYWYKRGSTQSYSLRHQLVIIIKARLRQIAKTPRLMDSLSATISLVIEVLYVSIRFRKWNGKYKVLKEDILMCRC